ncbi:MAG: HNH endonuclease [Verrucomicrobiia bacterium]|jgi:5-methylcytosine-specific restriction endonuclease McrA
MRNVLNENVLVLNRLWQAINVCTVERAFMLLYMGHAEVVIEDQGDFQTFDFQEWREFSQGHHGEDVVHTVSFKIRVPRVILLLFFDRLPHKEVKFTRHNIFERDHNMCQYCGKHFDRRELNLDHVIPRDRGGTTTWENIVCACIPCNTRKANRTPTEAGMHLIKKPKRPKWRPFVNVTIATVAHDSWKHFLDLAYWNVELGEDAG